MDEQKHRNGRSTPSITAIAGAVAIVVGGVCIALAWYHSGNTDQLWIQNQELISGGVGGLAFVFVGCALLIRDALMRTHSGAAPAMPYASAPQQEFEREPEPERALTPAQPVRRTAPTRSAR